MGGNSKVLTYKSSVLRRSDLALLKGPYYLNDCIIEFYFSYLSSFYDDEILLASPTVSFWLANSQNPEATFRDFEESNQLGKKQVVIFTVNDNQDMSQNDGRNHWSLLVYYRKSNAFVHYDSLGGLDSLVARKFYAAVKKYVGAAATPTTSSSGTSNYIIGHKYYSNHLRRMRNILSNKLYQFRNYHTSIMKKILLGVLVRGHSLPEMYLRQYTDCKHHYHHITRVLVNSNDDDTTDKDDDSDPWFREETVMPQQTNLYDCGLYVMCVAKVICLWYYDLYSDDDDQEQQKSCSFFLGDDQFPNIMKHLDASLEYQMLPLLLKLIHQLKREN